ncbi:Poly(ethylene terephthalate) hydrolase [Micromonospora sp. MH33]|uniref:alpha/beta hydrolase family protein n=1 Tax=Micromonospora sp. MH33 TaxID=1945509 RepID=UPI000D26561D|nr:hypothetical protein [Micromonospora sp. MH33]PSK62819.1 Poly(ethylene terephthalate) hydrolase [Micromonospora sp. MH33]
MRSATITRPRTPVKTLARLAVAAVLAVGGAVAVPAGAQAADNPYERGPAPTNAILEASRGPFATTSYSVSALSVTGFGGGVVYYPTSTSEGTFGAIAISPGYTATWSSLSWLGPRIASHGFVVIGIETNTLLDQPDSRGRQLLAALDYLVQRSTVRGRIDASRLAVAGHSMGGGGTLEAAAARPSLQAAVPLAPWNLDKTWSGVTVPTLIVGGESDTVAPPGPSTTTCATSSTGSASAPAPNWPACSPRAPGERRPAMPRVRTGQDQPQHVRVGGGPGQQAGVGVHGRELRRSRGSRGRAQLCDCGRSAVAQPGGVRLRRCDRRPAVPASRRTPAIPARTAGRRWR